MVDPEKKRNNLRSRARTSGIYTLDGHTPVWMTVVAEMYAASRSILDSCFDVLGEQDLLAASSYVQLATVEQSLRDYGCDLRECRR